MQIRPPGRSNRNISASARLFRADRFRTPLEITTSIDSSGSGMSSISPGTNSVQPSTPASAAWRRPRSHISSRMSSPIAFPSGPTRWAARMVSIPPLSRCPARSRRAGGRRSGRGSPPKGPTRRPRGNLGELVVRVHAAGDCLAATASDRRIRLSDSVLDLLLEHQVLGHGSYSSCTKRSSWAFTSGGISCASFEARKLRSSFANSSSPQHVRQNDRCVSTLS